MQQLFPNIPALAPLLLNLGKQLCSTMQHDSVVCFPVQRTLLLLGAQC